MLHITLSRCVRSYICTVQEYPVVHVIHHTSVYYILLYVTVYMSYTTTHVMCGVMYYLYIIPYNTSMLCYGILHYCITYDTYVICRVYSTCTHSCIYCIPYYIQYMHQCIQYSYTLQCYMSCNTYTCILCYVCIYLYIISYISCYV